MGTRILYIAEIVGKAGVFCVKKTLEAIKKEYRVDFTIACADGATGGYGLGKNHAIYLRKLGIDVMVLAECAYYKKDIVEHLAKAPYLLRSANYPLGDPGRGYRVYDSGGVRIGIVTLLGQSGFKRTHLSNPYTYLPEIAAKMRQETPIIIVDYHAATTAEKYTMFHHVDGQVSAVIGSHTRVQSADERLMPGGTAVICDAGRTGSIDSVGGTDAALKIQEFMSGIPEWPRDAWDRIELQGVVIEVGADGKATGIERIRHKCEAIPEDRERAAASVPDEPSGQGAEEKEKIG